MTSINRDIRDVNGWGGFGGYWEERLRKLDRQWEQQVPKNATNLFKGLRFWINGLTDPPVSELKQIFLQNGGIMDLVKTPKTDFEIVENLPRAKILRLLSHHQTVKPAFVTDSLKAGKLLDWKNYRLWQDNSGNLFVTKELILDAQFIGKLSCPDTVDESLYSPSEESEDDRLALSEELTLFLKGRKLPKSWDDYISPRKSIGEYYKKSRLHWLSTWRAELAHLVAEMPRTMPAAEVQMGQFIAHIDIDSFFVSVAILNKTELQGRPIAICHGTTASSGNTKRTKIDKEVEENDLLETHRIGHGGHKVEAGESFSEIASCSYEARALGIKADMYLGQALKICPELVVLDYQLADCKNVSEILYATCATFTPFIESVSCDELYIDLTDVVYKTGQSTKSIAREIKDKFKEKTGINVSIGLGPTRMLARMATKKAKPNGILEISDAEEIEEMMENTPFLDIPQIGGATLTKIKEIFKRNNLPLPNPIMCGDIVDIPTEVLLDSSLGPNQVNNILKACQGELVEELEFEKRPKTIGSDINYGIRFRNWIMAEEFLTALTRYVLGKMKKYRVEGTKMNIKLNYRAAEAEFEPIKYGGMGYCDSQTATKDVQNLTLQTVVDTAKNILSSFGVPLYDWRGIKMSFAVNNPEVKKNLKRKTDDGHVVNIEDFLPQFKQYHPSMNIIESRIARFRSMNSFEKREALKSEIKSTIQECFNLQMYLDYVDDIIGFLLDIGRRDLAEFCLIWARIPAVAAQMLKPRDWESFHERQSSRIHFNEES